jgi:hypothetical protein
MLSPNGTDKAKVGHPFDKLMELLAIRLSPQAGKSLVIRAGVRLLININALSKRALAFVEWIFQLNNFDRQGSISDNARRFDVCIKSGR